MTVGAVEEEDPRAGLRRGWVRVPGTCLYVGPLLLVLLPMIWLLSWLGADALYIYATLLEDAPRREASTLEATAGALVYLAIVALHEASHGAAARLLGGRVLRFGLGGGGAHVAVAGLENRPRASALVALAGPLAHLGVAAAILVALARPHWSETRHGAVLAVAAIGVIEAVVQLVPWRGPRRKSDGWRALAHLRTARAGGRR